MPKQSLSDINRTPRYYDLEHESYTYLDSAGFKSYAKLVKAAIAKIGEATIPAIHRQLGDAADPRRTMDALEMLQGEGSIVRTRFIAPSRWRMATASPARLVDVNSLYRGRKTA